LTSSVQVLQYPFWIDVLLNYRKEASGVASRELRNRNDVSASLQLRYMMPLRRSLY